MKLVRRERTGWRDLGWNLRQRCHGFNAPFCDIDCLAYDTDFSQPQARTRAVAIMEDVNENGRAKNPKGDYGIKAQKELANRDGFNLPFFGRRIASNYSEVTIAPLNLAAKMWAPAQGFRVALSEAEYVVWRHSIAQRSISVRQAEHIIADGLANRLNEPEVRSFLFSNLDDQHAIDRDLQKLDAIYVIKLRTAMDRRLNEPNHGRT